MEKILFTKYSNERASQFSIRTDIMEDNGEKWVQKQACNAEGREHVENIYQAYIQLGKIYKSTRISVNHCTRLSDGVRLEFLKGKTLQEVLDEMLKRKDINKFKLIIKEYIQIIQNSGTQKFVQTDKFREVFGEIEESERYTSADVTDIDMVLSNIFVDAQGQWSLIDYEWTFGFPIPIQYVIYRVLHYYECSNAFRNQTAGWNLYKLADITEGDKKVFQEMEIAFQKYVIGNYEPLRNLYPRISPGKTELEAVLENTEKSERMQIFLSEDGILREQDSFCYFMSRGYIKIQMEIDQKVSVIRLDPGERKGRVLIRRLEWSSGEQCTIRTNGIQQSETEIMFVEDDPQIYIENIPQGDKVLYAEFYKDTGIEAYALQIQQYREETERKTQEIEKLSREIQEKEKLINAMENTKVWKTYKKYKKIVKGAQD